MRDAILLELMDVDSATRSNVTKSARIGDGAARIEQTQDDRALQSFPRHRIQVDRYAHFSVELQLGRVSERGIFAHFFSCIFYTHFIYLLKRLFFLPSRISRHSFEWKREECYLIRKPDPAVLVAITKEVPGRVKSSAVQILDYNLNRHVFTS